MDSQTIGRTAIVPVAAGATVTIADLLPGSQIGIVYKIGAIVLIGMVVWTLLYGFVAGVASVIRWIKS
jgi:hypothetical protein